MTQYEVNAQIWGDTVQLVGDHWEKTKKIITWCVEETIEAAEAAKEKLRGNTSFLRVWIDERE